jgi:tRNA (uracil-5-)-methyltransferase
MDGDMLVTFIHDCPIEEARWQASAAEMQMALGIHISLMARAKGQVVFLRMRAEGGVGAKAETEIETNTAVHESLRLVDGRRLRYIQPEGSFSNPNGRINEQCLDWLCSAATEILCGVLPKGCSSSGDTTSTTTTPVATRASVNLLELFCGSGNHTIALAPLFDAIVAVELDRKLVEAAKQNATLNHVENVEFVRLHSHKFCGNLVRRRAWKGVAFDVVLVDPPRAGLDATTLSCIQGYPHILYISCSPISLERDMKVLTMTHRVQRFAVMDQFAGTAHLECGCHFVKRED